MSDQCPYVYEMPEGGERCHLSEDHVGLHVNCYNPGCVIIWHDDRCLSESGSVRCELLRGHEGWHAGNMGYGSKSASWEE